MSVGINIRRIRKEKGMTQKQLGEACGIAEPTIRRYELGKLNPKFSTLETIAKGLEVSVDELIDYTDAGERYLYAKQENKNILERASREQLEIIKNFFTKYHDPNKTREEMNLWDDEELGWEHLKLDLAQLWILVTDEMGDIILNYYNLNEDGRAEIRKRIEELTFVPKYQKKDGE